MTRLDLMIAAQQAQHAGFVHLAAALRALLAKEIAGGAK